MVNGFILTAMIDRHGDETVVFDCHWNLFPAIAKFPDDRDGFMPLCSIGNDFSDSFFTKKATPGFEPGDRGFADLGLTAWLCRRV